MKNEFWEEVLALSSVAMFALLLTGCVSTMGVSVLKIDSRTPEQTYAQVELEKVKSGVMQPSFAPNGTITTNENGQVGMMMSPESWLKIADVVGAIKGEFSFLSFDWTVKSDEPQAVRRVTTETGSSEERTYGSAK